MNKAIKNFNVFFENKNLIQNKQYDLSCIEAILRAILEPIIKENTKAIIFSRLKGINSLDSIIKRIEYSQLINYRAISDFEFSKFDVEETGFVILTTQRYNCAFLFKEVDKNKYIIYLKINSCLVNSVYEILKSTFLINYDEEFYAHRPERRDNILLNEAFLNLINIYEDSVEENICNSKLNESYFEESRDDSKEKYYENVKEIAHEIKNQLSVLDIYSKIIEKKTNNEELVSPLKDSIGKIKTQLELLKNDKKSNLEEKNIKTIIENSIKSYREILKENNNKIILIDETKTYEIKAFIDENKFLIGLNNIIKNANEITKDDEIIVKLSLEDEKIKIEIINHGQMIEKENQDKIFINGFSTKKDGWGIGLNVCKKYIESQFGTLTLEKSDKQETIFAIRLSLI